MNKRTFNKIINSCRSGKRGRGRLLDIEKVKALPEEIKTKLAMHIIRNRGPVLVELLTDAIDRSWLHSMGYLHQTKGARYEFVHTAEHVIK